MNHGSRITGIEEWFGPSSGAATERSTTMGISDLIGSSAKFRAVLDELKMVGPVDSAVLVRGETGTGKELIARAIHEASPRRQNRFVAINCAAIPAALLESELFGHERGAFTGAVAQTVGRFQAADRGTLFLDEIGDLPLDLQPKLLRALQEKQFERLGSGRTVQVDVRIIAATNRDLWQMVEEGKFRADLYYRLNVFPIALPPLRERSGDIPLLIKHFVQKSAERQGKSIEHIPDEVMKALDRRYWPGNIRELQNVIERAVILSFGPVLQVPLSDLKQVGANGQGSPTRQDTLEDVLRKHILEVLEDTNWVLSGPNGAAARLGVKRSTLQFRMHKVGICRTFQSKPKALSPSRMRGDTGWNGSRALGLA
jgi:formate hydrogenlyase transcriptional activator